MQNESTTLPSEELETLVETDATENKETETNTELAQETDSPTEEGNATDKDDRKEGTRTQRRIERLLREKYEAKARADYLEQVLASQRQSEPANDNKPQSAQYATPEEYIEALTHWTFEQREQGSRQQQQKQAAAEFSERTDKLFTAAEALADFDRDEFFSQVTISPAMAEAILESDLGAKLVVHLNANPSDASRIADLSPARQAAEIGKLEAKLSSVTVKKSAASKPITPLTGASVKPTGLNDHLSADEWMAMRNAQLYGKR